MIQMRWCDVFVSDFETVQNKNAREQENAAVWGSGFADLRADSFTPVIGRSIDEYLEQLVSHINRKTIVYFHNLKFDASFILDYLLNEGYSVAYNDTWLKDSEMPYKSIKTTISTQNAWYELCVRIDEKRYIYFRDSAKLLPYRLDEIGDTLGYEKLKIDYAKDRKPGQDLKDDEREYLIRDLEILWRALKKFIIDENHTGITIGSCCKSDYTKIADIININYWFPNIAKLGYDEYFRKAYAGGICYVNPNIRGKVLNVNGITLDVNSLYPSVMDSDRKYPIGMPHPFKGRVPQHVYHREKTFFIHFRCSFRLKQGKIPFIRVPNSVYYDSNELLTTTDITLLDGTVVDYYIDETGKDVPFTVELTLCEEDWKLFYKSYDIENLEWIDGAWFWTKTGKELFGAYVEKYKEKKMNSKGIDRDISKLLLNNLAGKLSAKPENTTRVPYLEDGAVKFKNVTYVDYSRAWYIPAACFITAYARTVLLEAIWANYENFCYCDTDSIHLTVSSKLYVKGVPIDDTEFGCWKIERYWHQALFVKQKVYIEMSEGTTQDGEAVSIPNITCAGMGKRAKQLLYAKLRGIEFMIEPQNDDEKEFLSKPFTINDFKVGISIPGNLRQKRIPGGTVLISDFFTIS